MHKLKSIQYINLPDGSSLYKRKSSEVVNLSLEFVKPFFKEYFQSHGNNYLIINLSMIDLVMNSSKPEILNHISIYKLIKI